MSSVADMESSSLRNNLREATIPQIALLTFVLGGVIIISTAMGYIQLPAVDVIKILMAKLFGRAGLIEGMDRIFPVVVFDVRLPRILSAAIVGAGLAISGVVFQGILLNPLADPYTLGVSAGAAFGASLAILLNIGFMGTASVPLFAFIGAVATLFFVMYLSASGGGVSSTNLILSGIIVAAILSAGISFLKYIADEQVAVIIFWLMGSFGAKAWADVGLTFLFVSSCFLIFMFFARDLNLMSLGDRLLEPGLRLLMVQANPVTVPIHHTETKLCLCVACPGRLAYGRLGAQLVRIETRHRVPFRH